MYPMTALSVTTEDEIMSVDGVTAALTIPESVPDWGAGPA
jgi:hypothetical protein